MNSRATIALLLVVLLAVGGLFYLRHYVPTTHEAAELRRYATVFDPETIDKIDLVRSGETITLQRDHGEWRLTSPVADRASPEAVDRLLLAVRLLEVRDRIAGDDTAVLTESGLSPPRLHIDLQNGQTLRLDLGANTALPGEIFARISGKKSILRVSDSILAPAMAPASSFRDPRLTNLLPDDIEKFTVRRADGEMTVRRERGRWMIDKPVRAPADPRAVREFLDPLLGLRVMEFGSATTLPGAAPLLPGETATLSLTPRGGGEALHLEVTRTEVNDGKSVTARTAARGGELQVDPEALRLFDVSPEALRDRSLGFVEADAVDRIRLQADGRTLLLQRHEENWADHESGKIVKTEDVNRLIEIFNATRIVKFRTTATTEETGLNTPTASVAFLAWLSENTAEDSAGGQMLAQVELGLSAADSTVYARRTASDEIVTISEELPQAIQNLMSPPPHQP